MSADFGALLDHDDAEVGVELLEADRRRQAGGTCPHDDDIEFHGFARRQLFGAHSVISLQGNLRSVLAHDPSKCERFGEDHARVEYLLLFPIFGGTTTME